jgi:hypothetical protein
MEILEIDVLTGKRTSFAADTKRALRALRKADIPFAVIGATALAVRGFPRMTKDLDVVVTTDDAMAALDALRAVGFESAAPVDPGADPEAMYVLARGGAEVDLLVASGEPESTVVAEATEATVFGERVPVATLEHLVLRYLYSNQVRHQGGPCTHRHREPGGPYRGRTVPRGRAPRDAFRAAGARAACSPSPGAATQAEARADHEDRTRAINPTTRRSFLSNAMSEAACRVMPLMPCGASREACPRQRRRPGARPA